MIFSKNSNLFSFIIFILCFGITNSVFAQTFSAEKSPLSFSMRSHKTDPSAKVVESVQKFSRANGGKWRVRYNPHTGSPESLMWGRSSKLYRKSSPKNNADDFLVDNAAMLNIDTSTLKSDLVRTNMGTNHVRYQQYYKGLPVEFSYTKVHIDSDGVVTGYQSIYDKDLTLDINPKISVAQAMQTASDHAGSTIKISSYTLVVYPDKENSTAYLAWKIRGRSFDGKHIWVYYVNAENGKIIFAYDDMRHFTGNVTGDGYTVSPIPVASFVFRQDVDNWINNYKVQLPMANQYVWLGGVQNTPYVTDQYGNFNTGALLGKVVASLKGPYFSVTNFRGQSAHWDNGSNGEWAVVDMNVESPHPYPVNKVITYPVNLTIPVPVGKALAKVYPIFSPGFQVGSLDNDGNVLDGDVVRIVEVSDHADGHVAGSYMGTRTNGFVGGGVEDTSFNVVLNSDYSTPYNGFAIKQSSCIILSAPNSNGSNNNVYWSTTTQVSGGMVFMDTSLGYGGVSALDETNAFYHLNKMRDYFVQFNKSYNLSSDTRTPIDLDNHVNAMVHANGHADEMVTSENGGMKNAYYDLDLNNMFFGDGFYDGSVDGKRAYYSFALDGTVVRHEYTHFIVHQIYNIINFGEFGAISESLSDYFALASFWQEGLSPYESLRRNLRYIGNFAMGTSRRDIGYDTVAQMKKIPQDWRGELYNDSLILSQALWSLRDGGQNDLSSLSNGVLPGSHHTWPNAPVSDLVVWGALFYFPDSFNGLYEAMVDVCNKLNNLQGNDGTCQSTKITTAFNEHGLLSGSANAATDEYEGKVGGLCNNNNGPECAADVTSSGEVVAYILPQGDVDYYTFTANEGNFTAVLNLPEKNYVYSGFMLSLYDENRVYLGESIPRLNSSASYQFCYGSEACTTNDPTVTLSYNLPKAGRYYLVVNAAPSSWADVGFGYSTENSTSPYTLQMSYVERGSVVASVDRAQSSADNDLIRFSAPVVITPIRQGVISTAPVNTPLLHEETSFAYVQLRDHRGNVLSLARTDLTTPDCLLRIEDTPTVYSTGTITGSARLQAGFAARYPAVGSVIVEVFGKNHMGAVISLGMSSPITLASLGTDFVVYDNIIKKDSKAVVKYSVQTGGKLTIKIYTQTGTLVKELLSDNVPAGKGSIDWDGTNSKGSKVASGIYFVKVKGPGLDTYDKIAVVR